MRLRPSLHRPVAWFGALVTTLALVAGACSANPDLPDFVTEGFGTDEGAPAGQLLIQQRNDEGIVELFELDLATGARTRLSAEGTTSVNAAWSPDGSRIVFAEQPPGDPGISIRVMDADGSNVETISTGSIDNYPTWSPDCSTIAFMAIDMAEARGELTLVAPDGSGRRVVWEGSGIPSSPQFSPDGSRIVFQAQQGADTEIIVLDLASGIPTVLTDNEVGDQGPKFSPDGTRVVYASRVNTRMQLFAVDATGGSADQLTRSNNAGQFAVWSPDGEWIAYERDATEISILRASGGEPLDTGLAGQPTDWGPKIGSC